ncbi:MAG TPA: hypothetical protein VFY61_19390 [Pyrinomonadaceae bacterium]|nr:hypothetical protein [Pyrinomonadaceae bacterium]
MNSVADEEMPENDVHYGIADCRRRLRSQRSTLRQNRFPQHGMDEPPPDLATALLEEREEAVIT